MPCQTYEKLKEALIDRRPVVVRIPLMGEVEYAYVSGIIYRTNKQGKIFVQAEITDKCLHSVIIVDPKSLSFKEE